MLLVYLKLCWCLSPLCTSPFTNRWKKHTAVYPFNDTFRPNPALGEKNGFDPDNQSECTPPNVTAFPPPPIRLRAVPFCWRFPSSPEKYPESAPLPRLRHAQLELPLPHALRQALHQLILPARLFGAQVREGERTVPHG